MNPRTLSLPLALLLAASAQAQSNPLFISGNVMTGQLWHAATTPGDGSSGSCSVQSGKVNYFVKPFFTNTTADSYSLHLYYESFQFAFVYVYQDAFDPTDPCEAMFVFGLGPLANIDDIHLDANRQYFFVTSEAELFGGGGSFQVTIDGPTGSGMFLGTAPPPDCTTVAAAQPYGVGKAGTNGVPTLSSTTAPHLGQETDLTITGGLPGASPVALFAGFAMASLAFDGGTLLVDPFVTVMLPALGTDGSSSLHVQLPDDAALCGVDIFLQGMFVDPAAAGSHHTAQTNGLHWQLGG